MKERQAQQANLVSQALFGPVIALVQRVKAEPDTFTKIPTADLTRLTLLASPRYRERWGRHWLDVARYADSVNDTVNAGQRYAWSDTYRDWIINALNEDLPYNRFLLYQLAADRDVAARCEWEYSDYTTMDVVTFNAENPEFNGAHVCPRCGTKSVWKVVSARREMIHVRCEGECGDYTMSYGQLRNYPLFKRNPPRV